MDSNVLSGKWKQLKGTVRARWGELTDDDVEEVRGNAEVLVGKIQERYGHAKDKVRKEVNDWLKDK